MLCVGVCRCVCVREVRNYVFVWVGGWMCVCGEVRNYVCVWACVDVCV